MARTRSENYDDIRDGILRKAAALFAERGYERTSITDLVDACGLSRGALYHYFASKEAILFAMMDGLVRGLFDALEAAVAPGGAPVDVLARAIETFVDYNARSPLEQRVILNELGALSPKEQAQIREIETRIVDLVADALVRADAAGRMTRRTKKVYTMMLIGVLNYAHTWYDPEGDVTPKDFARIATDLFLDGFLPRAAAPRSAVAPIAASAAPAPRRRAKR